MREWMENLLLLHGAKPVSEDDEDPVFMNDAADSKDGDSSYQEDNILNEIIKKI